MTVRPVTAGDGEARARLWRECGRYFADLDPATAQEPDPDALVEWLDGIHERHAGDAGVLMLVAEAGGAVVGEVAARLHEPLASARWQLQRDLGCRRVHVDLLVVAAAARRAGIGAALMAAVERWAAERGAAVVTLETGLDNPASMPFYECRMGYRRHEVVFRKVLG